MTDDHFTTGAFAAAGRELFRTYTCLGCGLRAKTWAAFKAHRRVCPGHQPPGPPPPAPTLTGDDLDRLADLYEQLRAEGGA